MEHDCDYSEYNDGHEDCGITYEDEGVSGVYLCGLCQRDAISAELEQRDAIIAALELRIKNLEDEYVGKLIR